MAKRSSFDPTNSFHVALRLSELGYYVVPLHPGTKAAVARDWTQMRLLPADIADHFANGQGVGLLLGVSQVDGVYPVAPDVDAVPEDPVLVERVGLAFDVPPPRKIGKKGATYIGRSPSPLKKKLIGRKDPVTKKSVHVMEILGLGQQTVLPPSIHPATEQPYFWVGRPLWEVVPQDLPLLTDNVLNEIEKAVHKPDSPLFDLNTMVPSDDETHEAGTIHTTCLRATSCLVGYGWMDDAIWRRVEVATKRADPSYEKRRNWEQIIRKMIADSRSKGHDVVSKKVKPHVLAARWLINDWKNAPGRVFNRDQLLMSYQDGHYQPHHDDTVHHVLAKHYPEPQGVSFSITDWKTTCGTALAMAERWPEIPSRRRRVCLLNGTFDLDEKQLREWDASDFLIAQLPFDYDDEARCPTYDKVLHDAFANPDDEEEAKLACNTYEEFVAMTMVECHDFQKFLFLRGVPGTGKSTLLDVPLLLHGEKVPSVPVNKLGDERYVTHLLGRLVSISTEVAALSHAADDALKAITSGDPVMVRHLFKEPLSIILPTRLIYAGNEMFRTRDTSGAIERRMLLLSCDNLVPPEGERIGKDDMKHRLRLELPGIFNRMVVAWHRLQRRGCFKPPKELDEALQEFSQENNPVQRWFLERTWQGLKVSNPAMDLPARLQPGVSVELFSDFAEWMKGNGHQPMSSVTWGNKLKQMQRHYKDMDFSSDVKWVVGKPVRVRNLTLVNGAKGY